MEPFVVHQIDEEKIKARFLAELPAEMHEHFNQAWANVIRNFKKESVQIK
jgi:hypothetical protein